MIDTQFYKGTLQPIVLKLLQENDKMYGYEIIVKGPNVMLRLL